MKQLQDACENADDYPFSLVHSNTYDHHLQGYLDKLNAREAKLFRNEKCTVDFFELDRNQVFQSTPITKLPEIKSHLWKDSQESESSPLRCRFMFMTAPNARSQLKLSRAMMSYSFTYHQVPPSFLDFILPFGKSEWGDFHYSSFRHESSVGDGFESLSIPQLGRSGAELRLCYSFKSAEMSPSVKEWPWSIRAMAVYHSFDVNTGHAEWIIVKANKLIKERIMSTTDSHRIPSITSFGSVDEALASSLRFHILFCDWAAEGWRMYLKFLEESFQALTRRADAVEVETLPMTVPVRVNSGFSARTASFSSMSELISRRGTAGSARAKIRSFSGSGPTYTASGGPLPPIEEVPMSNLDCNSTGPSASTDFDFAFSDLQAIQHLLEKANETALTIKSNLVVIIDLSTYYKSLLSDSNNPPSIQQNSTPILQMQDRLLLIQKDLQMQLSRTESLLTVLADRKTLLAAILEYRNMEASRTLTERTQHSTDNMEKMTRDMQRIAQKTQQETVSMRIITLVTLFFLPGTFISTLMSTDIVRFDHDDAGKRVSYAALCLYLAITLPLMLVTFIAWYAVYWWVNAKDSSDADINAPLSVWGLFSRLCRMKNEEVSLE